MPTKRTRSGRLASFVVKTGIVLFAVATFLSLRLQVGLAFPVALASSLVALSLLMILDGIVRGEAPGVATGHDVDRLENEIARLMGAAKARQDDREVDAGAMGRNPLGAPPRPANDTRRPAGAPPPLSAGTPAGGGIPTARVPLPRPGGDPRAGRPSLSMPPPIPSQRAPSAAAPPAQQPAASQPVAPQPPSAQSQSKDAGGRAPKTASTAPGAHGDNGWPDTVMPSGSPADFWSFRPNAAPQFAESSGAPTLSVREPLGAPRQGAQPTGAPAPRQATPGSAKPDTLRADTGLRADTLRAPPKAAAPVATASGAPPARATAGPRPSELEVVQGLIKKLADEVNAAEASAAGKSGKAPPRAEGAINRSINALRATSETMRKKVQPTAGNALGIQPGGAKKPAVAPVSAPLPGMTPASGPRTPVGPQPPPLVGSAESRLVAIAGAITAGRVDVFLEPIRGLGDQVTRHYEVSVRLRGENGVALERQSDGELGGTGLLPSLDTARLVRVAEVARRLEQKLRPGSVFSAFNRESLSSDEFLNGFADVYRDRTSFSSQLVLTFTQRDVRGFSQTDWNTVGDMRDFGFRFALSEVTDLDMDFEELTKKGFEFVKLDADVFLNGLPTASSSLVPAHDLCQYLAGIGLTLVVGRIDDEKKLARIFGFGVVFGQGQLFGGARPVKANVVTRQRTAAA